MDEIKFDEIISPETCEIINYKDGMRFEESLVAFKENSDKQFTMSVKLDKVRFSTTSKDNDKMVLQILGSDNKWWNVCTTVQHITDLAPIFNENTSSISVFNNTNWRTDIWLLKRLKGFKLDNLAYLKKLEYAKKEMEALSTVQQQHTFCKNIDDEFKLPGTLPQIDTINTLNREALQQLPWQQQPLPGQLPWQKQPLPGQLTMQQALELQQSLMTAIYGYGGGKGLQSFIYSYLSLYYKQALTALEDLVTSIEGHIDSEGGKDNLKVEILVDPKYIGFYPEDLEINESVSVSLNVRQ